ERGRPVRTACEARSQPSAFCRERGRPVRTACEARSQPSAFTGSAERAHNPVLFAGSADVPSAQRAERAQTFVLLPSDYIHKVLHWRAINSLEQPALQFFFRQILWQRSEHHRARRIEHSRAHEQTFRARASHHHLAHFLLNLWWRIINPGTLSKGHSSLTFPSILVDTQHHSPFLADSSRHEVETRSANPLPNKVLRLSSPL